MPLAVKIRFWNAKGRQYFSLGVLIALFLLPSKSFALSEEELQLALLLKVSQFTTWTERNDQEFKFCLYRGKGYEDLVSSSNSMPTVGKLPVHFVFLKQNTAAHLIHQCHLLFVTERSATETKQILRKSVFSPTLTVSTLDGFADMGGMIELVRQGKRYTFRINLQPVKESELNLSASLLEISSVIRGGN
ncbi:YfiR family protein [Neptuniibacter sp. PT8_73]|uniref:YfiR family protein n=1 Tax=unclassified Neptuniibacter TaxID=2630693 RepID=UPI0039F6C6B3